MKDIIKDIKVFGIGPSEAIANAVCRELQIELSALEHEKFPDGELKICPKVDVKNSEVFVFHSLGGDSEFSVNDRLCELYFFLSSLRDQGARRITAMVPYLSYARSDQRKNPFDSVLNKYVAQMLEGSGIDLIITLDVHNISAFENAFRCPCLNLEAAPLFCQYLATGFTENSLPLVLSPDIGGIKRAEKFRKNLETVLGVKVDSAFLEKFRTKEGMTGEKLVGDVEGKSVFIVDDMISTGETIMRAVGVCHRQGARSMKVLATHGLFTKNQNELLNSPLVDEFIVMDGHPRLKDLENFKKLKILSCASLFAGVINEEK